MYVDQSTGSSSMSKYTFEPDLERTKLVTVQPIPVPQPNPPRGIERQWVKSYQSFRRKMHSSPIYTTRNVAMTVKGTAAPAPDPFDAFQDQRTYSTIKYRKAKRSIPAFSHRPYVLDLLPPELQYIVDASQPRPAGEQGMSRSIRSTRTARKRRLERVKDAEHVEANKDDETTEGAGLPSVKRKRTVEEFDDEDPIDEAEEDEDNSDADNEFADEDDPENDYNAERYFDDEEGLHGDVDGDDGGDGGGYDD